MDNFACRARICARPTRVRTAIQGGTFIWPLPCHGRDDAGPQPAEDGDEFGPGAATER